MPGHADPREAKSLMHSVDWKPAPVPEEGAWGQGDKLYGALAYLQCWLLTAARTSEGDPLASLPQELLIYILQTLLLEQGLWGDVISVGKFVAWCFCNDLALVLLRREEMGPPEVYGPESLQVCNPDCKQHVKLGH